MKTVLLLGANSDVAKACIKQYHDKGYKIIAASRNTAELTNYKDSLNLNELEILHFDALDYASHSNFYNNLNNKPHIVVYAAGYLVDNTTAINNFDKNMIMMQTNYCGALSILNIITKDTLNNNLERIIGISSLSATRGRKSNYIYGSTKAAFTHYLEGLRQELTNRNITVNVLTSGYIRTKINAGLALNESLIMEPDFVANKIINAGDTFEIVPGFKWKMIHFILKHLPESLVAKLP